MVYKDPRVSDPAPIEKLGAFYLGRLYDSQVGQVEPAPLLYDAKDLTTHAVCVGMTGSGKTGLCVSLLEEAAIDGIPAIAIDPKGDIGNLLLGFPNLDPSDFEPWIDPGEAVRKGATVKEHASNVSSLWRKGLADWGEDGRRIARLKDAVDIAIYTPGSNAGLPISLLRSFAAPPAALLDDLDLFRDRVGAAVSGLLALVGVDADPVRSREHILLSSILDHHWRQGQDLDLASLIREIQQPPFAKVGVMDLEAVYPANDRFALSMTVNNLMASPGFAAWMEGPPLDISKLLWTESGKPRIAILSIAHLSEAERMFFVTVLLNEIVAWIRSQSGTTSLRALLYMDEVFGYLPPTANPPSKKPMLTLLKQARAFGLGVVLATQNPVDLDYKGLSNTGTWFIGRLQTERDKLRVLDGLEGASTASGGEFDRKSIDRVLSGLSSRVFLMNDVHEDAPVMFHTRWALSYLRGPLTREQIKTLMADRRSEALAAVTEERTPVSVAAEEAPDAKAESARPMIPPGIREAFLPVTSNGPDDAKLLYRPALHGMADLHYANARIDLDSWRNVVCLAPLKKGSASAIWKQGQLFIDKDLESETKPEPDAQFGSLISAATQPKRYTTWQKALKSHLYRECGLTLATCKDLKLTAAPDEDEAAFRVRVRQAAHERRDLEVEKLRKRYAPKLARLQQKIRTAEQRLSREESQYSSKKVETAISLGATVLGALFGRKVASAGTLGRAGTTLRGAGRAARERQDVQRAKQDLAHLEQQFSDLSQQFERDAEDLRAKLDPELLKFTETVVRPRKSDMAVADVKLLWTPWWVDKDGIAEPASA